MSLLTINQDNPTHLYLIDSGNCDDAYKIGISSCLDYRLETIREDYKVPNATLLVSKLFDTRTMALNVEAQLHTEYFKHWNQSYAGNEWFLLDQSNVNTVKEYYQ